MLLEAAEDACPEFDIVDEQESADPAIVEVDVHLQDRVILLVEIGPAETLAAIPLVEALEADRIAQVVAGMELHRRALNMIGAIVEEDLEIGAGDAAGDHRIADLVGAEPGRISAALERPDQ